MEPFVPFDQFDVEKPLFGPDEIRKMNAQRHEMEFLDRILHVDIEEKVIVGARDIREGEFWERGHFPDRPLFPGVLMIESAAQLASFFSNHALDHGKIMAFGAADKIRFRGSVVPGQTLVLQGRGVSIRRAAQRFATQGWVDGKLVFEGEILGVMI